MPTDGNLLSLQDIVNTAINSILLYLNFSKKNHSVIIHWVAMVVVEFACTFLHIKLAMKHMGCRCSKHNVEFTDWNDVFT